MIDSPRSKLRGIIDPLHIFFIALANPAASYGECARRIQFFMREREQRVVVHVLIFLITILSNNYKNSNV